MGKAWRELPRKVWVNKLGREKLNDQGYSFYGYWRWRNGLLCLPESRATKFRD